MEFVYCLLPCLLATGKSLVSGALKLSPTSQTLSAVLKMQSHTVSSLKTLT